MRKPFQPWISENQSDRALAGKVRVLESPDFNAAFIRIRGTEDDANANVVHERNADGSVRAIWVRKDSNDRAVLVEEYVLASAPQTFTDRFPSLIRVSPISSFLEPHTRTLRTGRNFRGVDRDRVEIVEPLCRAGASLLSRRPSVIDLVFDGDVLKPLHGTAASSGLLIAAVYACHASAPSSPGCKPARATALRRGDLARHHLYTKYYIYYREGTIGKRGSL